MSLMQKTLKIQSFTGGFLLYVNSGGKVEKLIKQTAEEVAVFTKEYFTESPDGEAKKDSV